MMTQQNFSAETFSAQNFSAMREAMIVSQLRTVAVDDSRVIAALNVVPREHFVPSARATSAYVDTAIPLGEGRAMNAPLATARLINEADVQPGDHVLVIGAATGYAVAVLAELGATVVAVEESPALLASAKANLKGRASITVVGGDLSKGSKKQGPYDVILIDGAVDQVPDALVAQLKTGGRFVTGLIERGVPRLAAGRKSAGGFALVPFLDAACVTLPGFAQPKGFQF